MEAHDEFEPEWVWVDDEGTNVYAQGYGRDLTVIFSFSADKRKPSTSLANRVCTKYEGLETEDPQPPFLPSRTCTRQSGAQFGTFGPAASPTPISELG